MSEPPLSCLDCIEHGEPYDAPCDACGWYTSGRSYRGRTVAHDGVTFLPPRAGFTATDIAEVQAALSTPQSPESGGEVGQ
jgi:hypothetical protein